MTLTRREFLLGTPIALGAFVSSRRMGAQSPPQTMTGPMADAGEVYRPVKLEPRPNARPSMTQIERDELEHQIKCQCGCVLDIFTCRTTDFSCSVSPAMHSDVLALVDGGYTAPEILNAFQSAYGERVLMAPVKSGFNLLGYTMPFLALGAGAIAIFAVLRRWKARTPDPVPATTPIVSATSDELARLDQAVRRDA
jgi:cytochrome c-type biogenesis protein CcmH